MVSMLLAVGAIVSWWLEGWKANESGREMGLLDVREFLGGEGRVAWCRGVEEGWFCWLFGKRNYRSGLERRREGFCERESWLASYAERGGGKVRWRGWWFEERI